MSLLWVNRENYIHYDYLNRENYIHYEYLGKKRITKEAKKIIGKLLVETQALLLDKCKELSSKIIQKYGRKESLLL